MRLNEVWIAEGPLYEASGEDGPLALFAYYIEGRAGEVVYSHSAVFLNDIGDDGERRWDAKERANALLRRIRQADGQVDLAHWELVPEEPSYALGQMHESELMDDRERAHFGW